MADNLSLTESKKGISMLIGVLAVLVASAAAAASGPAGIAVLPYAIGGITAIVGSHQLAQGSVDKATATAACPATPTEPTK